MSDREFIFDENVKCELCNATGAFDIYGDLLCGACLNRATCKCGHDKTVEFHNGFWRNCGWPTDDNYQRGSGAASDFVIGLGCTSFAECSEANKCLNDCRAQQPHVTPTSIPVGASQDEIINASTPVSFTFINETESLRAERYFERIGKENWRIRAEAAELRAADLRKAANLLIDYCEAHGWGLIPEPYDSINPLLKLIGRKQL